MEAMKQRYKVGVFAPEGREKEYGHIPGLLTFERFENRHALYKAGVHLDVRAGIHGHETYGAHSIVLGGQFDDIDNGNTITYTGTGKRDERDGSPLGDQSLSHPHNKFLVTSKDTGFPVRVVRGPPKKGEKPYWGPDSGYRYDGLYIVTDYRLEKNNQGFLLARFDLERVSERGVQPPLTLRDKPDWWKYWSSRGDKTS
ncbi:PUA-like domain-containing protein [Flagelloscypha sp. PMI_526]|nr:PUA-like domain-containing protein [Flagelloscypha sp. PMI_526]